MNERGSILIIVLWWLIILGIMALALYAVVRPRMEIAGRLHRRAAAHYAASAILYTAMAMIHDDQTPGFDHLGEAWGNHEEAFSGLVFGTRRFTVGYHVPEGVRTENARFHFGMQDEESRLNVNHVPFAVLVRLFENACALPTMESERLAGAILHWRQREGATPPAGAAGVFTYHELASPYAPRHADFQIAEELLLVSGVTPQIFRQIEPFVTVYGQGAVNVNTASKMVLQCLGLGESAIAAIDAMRRGFDGELGTEDDVPFERGADIVKVLDDAGTLSNQSQAEIRRAVNARQLSVRSDNFRGHLVERLDNSQVTVHIIFVFNRSGSTRQWREL